MSYASPVLIANRALQKLGARRIGSLAEDSVNARACNACYETLRDAEIQAHPWNFAIKRIIITSGNPSPPFGKPYAIPLPPDFLRLLFHDPAWNWNSTDWQIEGDQLVTYDKVPFDLRYIARITDCNLMVVTFREALSCRMAVEMVEELTQSNEKKKEIEADYLQIMREARRTNALQNQAAEPPIDRYITQRL